MIWRKTRKHGHWIGMFNAQVPAEIKLWLAVKLSSAHAWANEHTLVIQTSSGMDSFLNWFFRNW